MKELKLIKICQCCGKAHTHLPLKYKVWVDDEMEEAGLQPFIIGYHFDCVCHSSLYVKASLVKEGDHEKAS
jgi:hypothetical protein